MIPSVKSATWCLVVLAACASYHPSLAQQPTSGPVPQLQQDNIPQVVQAMTLDEKAHMVVGMGMHFGPPKPGTPPDRVAGQAGSTYAIPRLGIPSIVMCDGPAGLRILPFRNGDSSKSYYCTAFPVASLLASSWDPALIKEVGEAMGSEVRDYGADILLAPAMNIHRNPLGGRNFEYYSEDPLIAGRSAAAMIEGIQSNGVGTSLKHFDANNQETSRNSIDEIISERAWHEIYLRGFGIAIHEAHPWTVMSSYNKINGLYASENPELLDTVLRQDWHYQGLVMTDWFGGKDPVAQMKAGNELLMPGTPAQVKAIETAVTNGTLSESILDRNVARVLGAVVKSPTFRHEAYSNHPDLQKDAAVDRKAASESMVLLRNEGHTLPLGAADHQVALFGNTSYNLIAGGTGSGDVNKAYMVELTQGLKDAGFSPDADLQTAYRSYLDSAKAKQPKTHAWWMLPPPIPEMNLNTEALQKAAQQDQVAVLTIGRISGEGSDRKVKDYFNLSSQEQAMIDAVSQAFHAQHKKVIVVLNIGSAMNTASWRDKVDAILLAYQPGQEGGHSIADVLDGTVDPSGRLATSFPMHYSDVPSAGSFPGTPADKPTQVTYKEGIYVGYRYYDTHNIPVAYPFGFGLSYTHFRWSDARLSSTVFHQDLTIQVKVTNTGKQSGKDVVELYLHAPATTLDKPTHELKGFAKTHTLEPGQSETVTLVLHPKDLASYDPVKQEWVAEAGRYEIQLASSSKDVVIRLPFDLNQALNLGR